MSENKPIYIVTTLMRSGSSMMMRILEAGGLPVFFDKPLKKDEDNPNGYYETRLWDNGITLDKWEGILEPMEGKAVKMLCHYIDFLPRDRKYKLIFMTRNIKEILQSRKKMMVTRGVKDSKTIEQRKVEFDERVKSMRDAVAGSDCFEFIEISYNDLMQNPQKEIKKVCDFIGLELDYEKMCSIPEQALYRNRFDNG